MRFALRARAKALRANGQITDTQIVRRSYDSRGNVRHEWVLSNGEWVERPSTIPAGTRSLASYLNDARLAYYDTTAAVAQGHTFTFTSATVTDSAHVSAHSAIVDIDQDATDPSYGLISSYIQFDSVSNVGDLTHASNVYAVMAVPLDSYCIDFGTVCDGTEYLEESGTMAEAIADVLADTVGTGWLRQATEGSVTSQQGALQTQAAAYSHTMARSASAIKILARRVTSDSCWKERGTLQGTARAVILTSGIGLILAFVSAGGSLALAAANITALSIAEANYKACMQHYYPNFMIAPKQPWTSGAGFRGGSTDGLFRVRSRA